MQTILIVDDEVNIRFALSLALSDDYKIIEASNGIEGLEMFDKYSPDLIITDCNMPILSGIDFVREIRSKNTSVKIIAHTSNVYFSKDNEMLIAGANLCFSKPTSLAKIEQAIKFLLEDKESL